MAYLEDLETIVRTQIRDNGAIQALTNTEIDVFIADAITKYSGYKPRKRPFVLNLVPGTATYLLPDDWMHRDRRSFERVISPTNQRALYGIYAYEFDTMMMAPANIGLRDIVFDWYDSDHNLTLTPAPMQAYTLNFDYEALHQVSSQSATPPVPCTIVAQDQYAAMYWASARALNALITDKSAKLQNYKVANSITVNNTQMIATLEKRADKFESDWTDSIRNQPAAFKGGDMSQYNVNDYAWGEY